MRGGSWDAVPFFSRSVHRQSRSPNDQTPWIGFRCAADAGTTTTTGGGGVNLNLGASPDPASLGVIGSDEETTANSQPTLPPVPTTAATATQAGTLPPG